MRTHTFSIAVAHLQTGDWSVAIVQKSLERGRVVNEDLVYGPHWVRQARLEYVVQQALKQLQHLVHEDEVARLKH